MTACNAVDDAAPEGGDDRGGAAPVERDGGAVAADAPAGGGTRGEAGVATGSCGAAQTSAACGDDVDCDEGAACVCDPVGFNICLPAPGCRSDGDCDGDALCVVVHTMDANGCAEVTELRCSSSQDDCEGCGQRPCLYDLELGHRRCGVSCGL